MDVIKWHTQLTLAREASEVTKKPILLDFFNPE